jgi:hypothetical protein
MEKAIDATIPARLADIGRDTAAEASPAQSGAVGRRQASAVETTLKEMLRGSISFEGKSVTHRRDNDEAGIAQTFIIVDQPSPRP